MQKRQRGSSNLKAFAPIGNCVGGMIGWRGVFWALTPLGVLNLVWNWISLPSMPPQAASQ